ncbi:unknown [Crocosphaera subtropica ATCC 51142]|uniref:CAAX prenyl protease 2/Lysostaphin resistance protein A-like domain-containing protein n=1 Tax=Crocosphaera subtropica (strain ATCC 51142 / BH68) TaxID=43989 RepID=B1WRF6_CROS5|nr:CPBP family glutamic-type intramembrane protease [Crocosphaera subtropica]ACB51805.1 unknown [Crocosphaera subtropica ATCC 51142]
MTTKRIILIVLTIISLIPVILSLIGSINQPQVQSNLQLYQTNLVLQASEFSGDNISEFEKIRESVLGKNPYQAALKQYKEALKLSQKNLTQLETNLEIINQKSDLIQESETTINSIPIFSATNEQQKLQTEVNRQKEEIETIKIKIGLLEIAQGNRSQGLGTLDNIELLSFSPSVHYTADILSHLWDDKPSVLSDSESTIKNELNGWFRYYSLNQLYQVQNRNNDLVSLQEKEQEAAQKALIKLTIVAIIPVLGGLIGIGIIIFSLVQLAVKKESSILAIDERFKWKTPWTLEIPWQVLVVGFLFFGQIVLPILVSFLNIDLTELTLRGKAFYVLGSYVAMSVGGIGVLYLSIKPFLPLPKDWFNFNWLSNWIVWGVGGYLVALPLVVIISLINQNIWDGQGGSNPLLSLALEGQDIVVLAIFYFTAAIAAPVYEEIMFRGFLLPSLTRYLPLWGAIGLSSVVFAVAHLNLSEVLPLTILGMVLGVVYTKSRNLLSSMLLHSLWNSGTLISLFLLGSGSN